MALPASLVTSLSVIAQSRLEARTDGKMRFLSRFFALIPELTLLVSIIQSIFMATLRIQPTPRYVRQFKDFDSLVAATPKCPLNLDQENEAQLYDLIEKYSDPTKPNWVDRLAGYPLMRREQRDRIPDCPIEEERLKGNFKMDEIINFEHVERGGTFKPGDCLASQKVAIVVPYRNRVYQLERFTEYMHQFLPSQLVEYTIYVIEQADKMPFNRAKLFNVGAKIIDVLERDICCLIFHDVDMLPLDQRNLYMCTDHPKHMSPNLSTLRFYLLYPQLFGGAIAVTRNQFDKIGGFSNEFYGWGGEDDDFFLRVRDAGYGIDRTPDQFGDYHMMNHVKSDPNPNRFEILDRNRSSTESMAASFQLKHINRERLYTLISVEL